MTVGCRLVRWRLLFNVLELMAFIAAACHWLSFFKKKIDYIIYVFYICICFIIYIPVLMLL